MTIRILLADDHEVVRDGLRAVLERQSDFRVVGVAADGRETVQMAQEHEPDVNLMDINMPNMTGVEATRQIKASTPDMKILTLSVHSRSPLIAQMINAGASGYVPKSCAAKELVEAIRTVMRNHTYISPKVMDSVVDYLQGDPAQRPTAPTTLTPREREVLNLVADGKTTKEISECMHVSEKTVESHRYRIMDKLGIHSIAELTKYAIREGLSSLDAE